MKHITPTSSISWRAIRAEDWGSLEVRFPGSEDFCLHIKYPLIPKDDRPGVRPGDWVFASSHLWVSHLESKMRGERREGGVREEEGWEKREKGKRESYCFCVSGGSKHSQASLSSWIFMDSQLNGIMHIKCPLHVRLMVCSSGTFITNLWEMSLNSLLHS